MADPLRTPSTRNLRHPAAESPVPVETRTQPSAEGSLAGPAAVEMLAQPSHAARPASEVSESSPVTRRYALTFDDLSELPSPAALHALTEHDLPAQPPPPVAQASEKRSLAGLHARTVHDIPELPSLAALYALTEHDLPSTDGRPMPESSFQHKPLSYSVNGIRYFLRHRPGTFVASDLLVYAAAHMGPHGRASSPVWVAPDLMVAFDVGAYDRRSYVTWKEGKPPDFVLEVASTSTWKRDRDEKPVTYASLGVKEYFLYDVMGGLLEPRLQGHELYDGAYRRLPTERLANGESGVRSRVLGLCAYLRGPRRELRWQDPTTGRDLEDHDELHEARAAAEREVAELRSQIRRLQGRKPRT